MKLRIGLTGCLGAALVVSGLTACATSPSSSALTAPPGAVTYGPASFYTKGGVIVKDDATGASYAQKQVLVLAKSAKSVQSIMKLVVVQGGTAIGYDADTGLFQVSLPGADSLDKLQSAVTQFSSSPDVAWAGVNTVAPLTAGSTSQTNGVDPSSPSAQWLPDGSTGGGNWGMTAIGVPQINQDLAAYGKSNQVATVKVGLIDGQFASADDTTGVVHDDVNVHTSGQMWVGCKGDVSKPDCESGTDQQRLAAMNNGLWDQGTHVAGIIGATGKDQGVTGVAPNADMYGVSLLDANGDLGSGASLVADVMFGLCQLIVGDGVKVVDIGVTLAPGVGSDPNVAALLASLRLLLDRLMGQYQFVIVQAAGDGGVDASSQTLFAGLSDAEAARVITVGSYDRAGGYGCDASTPCNFGPSVDVLAPGDAVLSTVMLGAPDPQTYVSGFGLMTGTAVAAAHVAGVATAMAGVAPNLTGEQIKQIITGSASMTACNFAACVNPSDPHGSTAGLLDGTTALTQAMQGSTPPATPTSSAVPSANVPTNGPAVGHYVLMSASQGSQTMDPNQMAAVGIDATTIYIDIQAGGRYQISAGDIGKLSGASTAQGIDGGTYTVNGNSISLKSDRSANGDATGTWSGSTITFVSNGVTLLYRASGSSATPSPSNSNLPSGAYPGAGGPAPAGATSLSGAFTDPASGTRVVAIRAASGIGCEFSAGSYAFAGCGTGPYDNSTNDSHTNGTCVYYDMLNNTGVPTPGSCGTDGTYYGETTGPQTLQPSQVVTYGDYVCAIETNGWTCWSTKTGHGVFMSADATASQPF